MFLRASLLLLLVNINSCYSDLCDIRVRKLIARGESNGESILFENITYKPDQYFQVNHPTYGPLIYGCPCMIKPCYRKCCSKGYVFNKIQCVQRDVSAKYYEEIQIFDGKTPLNVSVEDNFIEIHSADCPSGSLRILKPSEGQPVYLQKNGSLLYTLVGYDYWAKTEDFCMEKYDRDDFKDLTALICLPYVPQDNTATANTYSAFLIVVLPFYLAIFLIYTLIPDLRNLHGICLANYSICLFFAFLFLAVVYLSGNHIEINLCVSAALITYFTFIASFLWLNVMCVDLWLTFRSRASYNAISKKKKITYYSLYAWGLAGSCLFIVMFLQFAGPQHYPDLILPKIGVESCWFPDDKTRGCYVYGPILFLIIVNFVLFILTAWNIWQAKKRTQKSMKNDSRIHSQCDRQKLLLYLKLFIAFGVNWSFELIPWLTGRALPVQKYLDIINILYGVVVFIIAVCSRKVIKAIKVKYDEAPWKKNSSSQSVNTTSTTATSRFF